MGTTGTTTEAEFERRVTAAVLGALHRESRMHVEALGEAVGADPAAVDRACFRLQREGHVRARGGGEYSITALGERRVRRFGTATP